MRNTITVGSVQLMALSDGSIGPPPSQFMPNVPAEAWEAYRADHLDANGNLQLNLGSYLLRTGGLTVLVDTGSGGRDGGPLPPGTLMEEMKQAGITTGAIDRVVITHMHFDHIGWNTIDQGGKPVPTFPNARYVIQRSEWEHWTKQDAAKQLMAACALPIEQAGLLDLVDPNHQPAPGLTMLPTPGHTPGHISVLINSGDEHAVILGDVAHSTVQVTEADWSPTADTDQELSRITRAALWDRIEQEGLRIAAGHFPAPGFGRIVRLEGKRSWRAG